VLLFSLQIVAKENLSGSSFVTTFRTTTARRGMR